MIATEDEKSSRLYFERFKEILKAHRIVFIPPHEGSSPKNVIDAAKRARDQRAEEAESGTNDAFDEIWVVFDTEGPQNTQRGREARNAVDRARQLNFRTAISNPSFEYWLILHYEKYVGPINNGKAACRLLRKHIKDYDKSYDVFHETYEKIDIAIKNAQSVFRERHNHTSQHPCDCHPCTEIYRLVESLQSNT